MLSSLPPHIQQRLAILVPVIALAVSLFVVYPGWNRWGELRVKVAEKRQRLEELRKTPIPMLSAQQPAVEETPSEAPEFLAAMRAIAAEAGCNVVGFDLTLPPAPATGEKEMALGGNPDPAKQPEQPKLVKPVRGKIEIEADYDRVRTFVRKIMDAPRLYAIVGVEVGPAKEAVGDQVRAVVEIERYVLNPNAPPLEPPPT